MWGGHDYSSVRRSVGELALLAYEAAHWQQKIKQIFLTTLVTEHWQYRLGVALKVTVLIARILRKERNTRKPPQRTAIAGLVLEISSNLKVYQRVDERPPLASAQNQMNRVHPHSNLSHTQLQTC